MRASRKQRIAFAILCLFFSLASLSMLITVCVVNPNFGGILLSGFAMVLMLTVGSYTLREHRNV